MSTLEVQVLPTDVFNQTLVENTHPPDWKNPEPTGRYNLVVVGAGTAGLVSAAGAAALGTRVALIERNLMGGDCLNYGCVPSKALIRASRAAHEISGAHNFGISAASTRIDFAAVMQRLRRVRSEISVHDSVQRFTSLGADVYLGNAKFVARNAVEVDGARLEFSKAIIATGARAAELPVPGLKEIGYLTNETVFSVTELPKRLIVIGAGPIGCELAQAFRRLGSAVTIFTHGNRILPREDPAAAAVLGEQFTREQIELVLGANVVSAAKLSGGKVLFFDRGRGAERLVADEILVAVGRAPNIEGMNLEAAGVKYHSKGVEVDDHLRTSNADIYAAGDISSRFQFTHAAEALARIAVQNALFFGRKKASRLVIPWCTYTDPEIAHVGMYEKDARSKGIAVQSFNLSFSDNDRAVVDGNTVGFARVHTKEDGTILGATLVSQHAGESIGEFTLAMNQGLKLGDLSGVIHPYPTEAEIIKRLGDSSMKSRLKPWMKRLLSRFFAMRR
jgi:pyruvate/2-oxoglutarate dehydrogenase complex dihydrolipoamide dehydrogenase (E3) component